MKKIVMIFAAMAAVLSSCNKNEIEPVSKNDGKDIVLNIRVSNPGADDTKALIKEGWVENDEIHIWFDARVGTETPPLPGEQITPTPIGQAIIGPSIGPSTSPVITPDLVIKYDGSKWTQEGTVKYVPNEGSGYVKAVYDNKVIVASKDNYSVSGNILTFDIENWTFLTEVQVVVKDLTSDKASDYTLACDKFTPLASTGNGYTVGENTITSSSGTKGDAVTGISNTDGVAFVFATADYSTSSTEKKDFAFVLRDKTSGSEVTKVYKPNVAIEAKTNKSSIKALTIASTKFIDFVIPEFVDLGLASGLKWRSWSLGASKPEEYGKYFSWGDVTGQPTPFTNAFDWEHAPFNGGKSSYDATEFDKVKDNVCPDGVLANDYDAAQKANKGRMPTKENFVELAKACFAEWTENYDGTGVKGVIFWKAKGVGENSDAGWFKPATDGKGFQIKDDGSYDSAVDHTFSNKYDIYMDSYVFFPAAGVGYGSSHNDAGSTGSYWSSSLSTSGTNSAFNLYFYSISVNPQSSSSRHTGRSVRPVSD